MRFQDQVCNQPATHYTVDWASAATVEGNPGSSVEFVLLDDTSHFLFVILPIEDFPFCASFGDTALLAFNFVAGRLIYLRFLLQPFVEDLDNRKTNCVAVFNELDRIDGCECFRDRVGEDVHFFTSQTHG